MYLVEIIFGGRLGCRIAYKNLVRAVGPYICLKLLSLNLCLMYVPSSNIQYFKVRSHNRFAQPYSTFSKKNRCPACNMGFHSILHNMLIPRPS